MNFTCYRWRRCARPPVSRPAPDRTGGGGATPEAMLAAGFKPVGGIFRCFCTRAPTRNTAGAHRAQNRQRTTMALSATPRPTSPLEEDLARRDLTINAMAQTADGDIIDPTTARTTCAPALLRHAQPCLCRRPGAHLAPGALAARYSFAVAAGNRADATDGRRRQGGRAGG